ncbi:hypothetical protein CBR_g64875 [Chara braunii]|uniref:Reverse transcriptase/retrotransposon-derived protein RNase H-like domain-containing protein n=1 Tax=Chara braunii TaxID=69332 RepID=A0A388K966_CHABU|nr:hypothetical protein CBR_g64875 [Chara braunii]|eukprot:GBG66602.1 hypothetical protein CBR_g64875 [Chara braunii]
MAGRMTFWEDRPRGILPPRISEGRVEINLPARNAVSNPVMDWVGVELVEDTVYLVVELEWRAREEFGGVNLDLPGRVHATGSLHLSEEGWRTFGIALASGDDPVRMFEGASQITWREGFEFADPERDDVTAEVRVATTGILELPNEVVRMSLPPFLLRLMGGIEPMEQAVTAITRLNFDEALMYREYYRAFLEMGPFGDEQEREVLCILQAVVNTRPGVPQISDEAMWGIIRREVGQGATYVDDLYRLYELPEGATTPREPGKMATEEETDNRKSEGEPGLGGSAAQGERGQKDRESINPDGTKGNRKEISTGESSGKAGGSRQGTQETKESRNKDRTNPRNSEGAVSKKASPRLLKGLRQLLTWRRVEIDDNPELLEGEREEEVPQEVANLQRSHGDLEDLEKAFADIRLSLPDQEGGKVMRSPLGTKLSFHALPVGKLKIQIGSHHTDALVDGGAEITLIRRYFATITGCMINKEVTRSIRGVGREIPFAGYVTKCAVKVGVKESIWSFQRMTVMEEMDHDIILGRPWSANVEMIGMHLHDGSYMVDIEDPVTGRGELLRLLGTGGDPPKKGKLATWSPSFEDSTRKGAFARMEGMRERVEIMIEEAFNKKEWIKMGLPQKKRRRKDEALGVMVAEKKSKVELGASLPKRKEVRIDVPEVALEIPDLLQLIKALRYHKVGVDSAALAKFEGELQKGYCLNGKLVSIQPRVVEATGAILTVHFLRERSRKEVFESTSRKSDPAKTDNISQWPTPLRRTTEVRPFLGVVGFWRIFIKNFANIVEPIRAMIREEGTMDWTEKREGAVQTLKDILTSEQVGLSTPCFNDEVGRPFILETDGGPLVVGGVLIQRDEGGKERPIRFESRTLNSAERRYSQFKKEVLAILHCLKTFQAYLFGRRFILRIDPTNLTGTLKNYRPIDPTVGRWVGFIWQFDYKIERIAGIRNKADGLSRVCITPEGVEDAEPIDAFLEYEGGTLAVDNERMSEGCTSGELLIQTLEKGAPAVVAELREGSVTTRGCREENNSWGAIVGPKDELIAMAVEGDREAVMSLVESWERKTLQWVVNQMQEGKDGSKEGEEFFYVQSYEGLFREIGLLLVGNKQTMEVSIKAREEAERT